MLYTIDVPDKDFSKESYDLTDDRVLWITRIYLEKAAGTGAKCVLDLQFDPMSAQYDLFIQIRSIGRVFYYAIPLRTHWIEAWKLDFLIYPLEKFFRVRT